MGLAPTVHGGAQVVMELRLPRIVGAVLVGAALSVSGAAYQVMFRNPMVSPTILGVSAGAAFGAAIAILLSLPVLVVHLTTFGGGLLAVAITYVVGVKFCRGGNTTLAIILSGIIVSTLFTSLLSMIKYVADPYDKLPVIVYWLMGSLVSITRDNLILPLLLMAAAFLLLYFLRWKINLLSFGDEEAKSLGIPRRAAPPDGDHLCDAHDSGSGVDLGDHRARRVCRTASRAVYRWTRFSLSPAGLGTDGWTVPARLG